jgi:DDE superfamily endonuclease
MAASAALPVDLTPVLPAARTLTAADLGGLAEELAAYHAHFAPLFQRRQQRGWAALYLRGLLTADVPRKNAEALALRLLGAGPGADRTVRAVQQFIGEGGWDDAAILAAHQRLVDETLGEDDGVLIVDGSEVPKQGTHSVGVARQWCGHTGKQDNCQAGVYLGYASRRGYTLLDRRLYLPAAWFAAEYRARWRACGIPRGTPFRTKHELAGDLVEAAVGARRVRARWVACDEGDGDSPALLDRWAAAGLVVPGRGRARHAGMGPSRAGRADAARAAGTLGAAPRRLRQGAGPDEGPAPPGQPTAAARGRVGGAGARRALAAVSPAGGEQGAAGGRLRRGAAGRGAQAAAGTRGLAAGPPDRPDRRGGRRVQVLPLERPARRPAGRAGPRQRHALADRGLLRRGAAGIGAGPLRDPLLARLAPPPDPRHPRPSLPGPAATAARPERGGPARPTRSRCRRAPRRRGRWPRSCRPRRSG